MDIKYFLNKKSTIDNPVNYIYLRTKSKGLNCEQSIHSNSSIQSFVQYHFTLYTPLKISIAIKVNIPYTSHKNLTFVTTANDV